MDLAGVELVVMRPRGAANLGAIARAMKNFGLARLTLVDPRLRSWTDAWKMAVQADDVLRAATTAPSLDQALLASASTWVVGTTMRPLPGQRVLTPREVAAETVARGGVTLLFGDEESGLQNAELLRCHAVSRIATGMEQPSVNLAQAVLVYAYELFVAAGTAPAPAAVAMADAATIARLEAALREALVTSGFADVDRPKHGVVDLMQPLRRAGLTAAEARLWLAALAKTIRR
jgi:TrmH family RNA methyltransferase